MKPCIKKTNNIIIKIALVLIAAVSLVGFTSCEWLEEYFPMEAALAWGIDPGNPGSVAGPIASGSVMGNEGSQDGLEVSPQIRRGQMVKEGGELEKEKRYAEARDNYYKALKIKTGNSEYDQWYESSIHNVLGANYEDEAMMYFKDESRRDQVSDNPMKLFNKAGDEYVKAADTRIDSTKYITVFSKSYYYANAANNYQAGGNPEKARYYAGLVDKDSRSYLVPSLR